MHHVKVEAILQALGMIGNRSASDVFTRTEVARQIRILRAAMSMKGVANRLGMSVEAVYSLTREGMIAARITAGEHAISHHFFDRYEISDFLRRAKGSSNRVFKSAPKDTDLIQVAPRRCYAPWMDVLRLLLNGKLQSIGTLQGRVGLNALLVNTREVKKLLGRQHEYDDITKLMKLFALPHNSIRELIALGHFWPRPYRGNRRKTRAICFDFKDVKRFMADYICGKEIAAKRKISFSRLLLQLQAEGIEPVIVIDKSSRCFYRRSQIVEWTNAPPS